MPRGFVQTLQLCNGVLTHDGSGLMMAVVSNTLKPCFVVHTPASHENEVGCSKLLEVLNVEHCRRTHWVPSNNLATVQCSRIRRSMP